MAIVRLNKRARRVRKSPCADASATGQPGVPQLALRARGKPHAGRPRLIPHARRHAGCGGAMRNRRADCIAH